MSTLRRSSLYVPVNRPRFVEKAWGRGSDSIILDLEDAVSPEEKPQARTLMREAISVVGKAGAEVAVRINHDTPKEDCDGSLWPGLTLIYYPKTETVEEIHEVDRVCSALESKRGIPPNSTEISAMIETAKGVWNAYDIATASSRIRWFGSVADGDLTANLGVPMEYLWEADVLAYARGECDLIARTLGLGVEGKLWYEGRATIADFGDAEALQVSSQRSAQAGYLGCLCIHPLQVDAFNRSFTPKPQDVAVARAVVKACEEAYARGEAYAEYKGRLVDRRVADGARDFLAFAEDCAASDAERARRVAELQAQEPENKS